MGTANILSHQPQLRPAWDMPKRNEERP